MPKKSSTAGPVRCSWCEGDADYVAYHDHEWGVAERDDAALFEKLILDGFQAGLSWIIILKKRVAFRRAFDGFDAARIARYDSKKLAALQADASIVRNRAKIAAAVVSAKAYLDLQQQGQSFSDLLWSFTDGRTLQNRWRRIAQLPTESEESRAMSKELKRLGFKFCGPTICYAFMQAVGMVNDHMIGCYRYDELSGT